MWNYTNGYPFYLYDENKTPVAAIYEDMEIVYFYNSQKDVKKLAVDAIPTDSKELEEFLEYWKTIIIMQWEG